MCGILGFVGQSDFNISEFSNANDLLAHRGPDDSGIWISENKQTFLGHRRLSILDLTSKGSQPMKSKTGRFVTAFNGEIYNHLDIRKDLEKTYALPKNYWHGTSDTETLLSSIELQGFENSLEVLLGMFSFAVWDNLENTLSLARDRVGEKPLYFSFLDKNLYFSSELKALKSLSKNKLQISSNSLGLFFKYNYIPAPYSIYKDTFKLEAGSFLSLKASQIKEFSLSPSYEDLQSKKIIKNYWQIENVIDNAKQNMFSTPEEALHETEKGLSRAIDSQLISDVPLGAFLSGGIDSSLVTALMQKNSMNKVKTFTIGFEEKRFDESIFAKKIASILGTDHTEHIISMDDALKIIPKLPKIYDEPFADSSQIPTTLVSEITRKRVTVALSGDGGDEFFGGYNRHFRVPQLSTYFNKIPRSFLLPLSKLIELINRKAPFLLNILARIVLRTPTAQLGDKIERLSQRLEHATSEIDLYRSFVIEWREVSDLVIDYMDTQSFLDQPEKWPSFSSFEEKMMYLDSKTYLPDDIMVKVDRASMSTSLETRAPFLDKNVIDLSFKIPLSLKIKNGSGKLILKEILSKYVDPKTFLRPKQGFGIPVSDWLKGHLKKNFEEVASKSIIQQQGFLNNEIIQKKWEQHQDGTHDWSHSLWSVYMFQLWMIENLN